MEDKLVNILLVEDDSVDVMNVQRAFKKNNIQNPLYLAKNGLEGLAMLRGTDGQEMIRPRPQIILLDLNMPQMNGFEVLDTIRRDEGLRHLPVVILSTSGEARDVTRAYDLLASSYMVKQRDFAAFEEQVRGFVSFWTTCVFPADAPLRS